MNNKNYYKILRISRYSSIEDIEKAFNKLSKKYSEFTDEESKKTLEDIKEAYSVLSKEKKKAKYDLYWDDNYSDNNQEVFSIPKEKFKSIIIVILVCIIFFGGSYFASELSYYKNNCDAPSTGTNDSKITNIGIEEYISLRKSDELSLIFIGQTNCSFSNAQELVFEELLSEYDIDVNYLNLDKLDNDGMEYLHSSYQSFMDDGISTPTIMLVQKDEVKLFLKGYTSKDEIIEILKEHKYIVE